MFLAAVALVATGKTAAYPYCQSSFQFLLYICASSLFAVEVYEVAEVLPTDSSICSPSPWNKGVQSRWVMKACQSE